jgi:hypothetical protein
MSSSADARSGDARRFELFHRIGDPGSARIRQRVLALGLLEQADFRNIAFDSHRLAYEERGGTELPSIWDGLKLWSGEGACARFLDDAGAGTSA